MPGGTVGLFCSWVPDSYLWFDSLCFGSEEQDPSNFYRGFNPVNKGNEPSEAPSRSWVNHPLKVDIFILRLR